MSKFDPNQLLNVEIQTSALQTERVLIPEGEWRYEIGKPDIASGDKNGKIWARVRLPMKLVDKAVLSDMNVEKASSRFEFFLDLDDNGALLTGTNENVILGQAFAAAGLHGEEATISQLEGRTVIGLTKEKSSENGSWNEVTKMSAID